MLLQAEDSGADHEEGEKSHFPLVPLATTLAVPQDSGSAVTSRGAPTFALTKRLKFTRKSIKAAVSRKSLQLETAIPKHSSAKRGGGHRLNEPYSIYTLRVVGTNGAELGWRQQLQSPWRSHLVGGRDSLGHATWLHQSIIASASRTFGRSGSHALASISALKTFKRSLSPSTKNEDSETVAPSLTDWARFMMERKPIASSSGTDNAEP